MPALPGPVLQASAEREQQVLRACECGTPVAAKAVEKKHGDFLVVWLVSPLSGPLLFGLLYGMPSWAVRVLESMNNGLDGHRGMGRALEGSQGEL